MAVPERTESPLGPRRRARLEALAEIKRIACGQLAAGGAGALSLREIAAEMGLVSSAVYRYVASRDALLTALISDAYNGLGEAAEQADAPLARDDLAARWTALAGSLRDWARHRPTDYSLVFGPPVAGYEAPPETYAPAQRWTEIMIDIVVRGSARSATTEAPSDLVLRERLRALRERRSPGAPLGSIAAALRAWAQLHGLVALEIYGQTDVVLGAPGEFFHYCVARQIQELGLDADREP